VAGWFKHSLKRIEDTTRLEPWMFLFHSIALYFIALAPLGFGGGFSAPTKPIFTLVAVDHNSCVERFDRWHSVCVSLTLRVCA